MLGPAGHFKIDGANKVVAIIEIDLDLFLPIRVRQKLFGFVHQCLVRSGRILSELDKGDDHPGLYFLKDLGRTVRKDFPELIVDFLLARFRSFFSRPDIAIGEFRLPAHVRILMTRK